MQGCTPSVWSKSRGRHLKHIDQTQRNCAYNYNLVHSYTFVFFFSLIFGKCWKCSGIFPLKRTKFSILKFEHKDSVHFRQGWCQMEQWSEVLGGNTWRWGGNGTDCQCPSAPRLIAKECQSIMVKYTMLVFADCHVRRELVFAEHRVHQVGIFIGVGLNDAQIPAALHWNSVIWNRCLQSESSLKHPVSSKILRKCLWVVQFAEALL